MASLAIWFGLRRQRLIDQQLWFLGRDICAHSGNGLLRYGFTRCRATRSHGSSAYVLSSASGSPRLVCWGFGVYLGDVADGDPHHETVCDHNAGSTRWSGLVLTRFDGAPRLVADPLRVPIHQVSELPPLTRVRCDASRAHAETALRTLAVHFATYERWAISTLGLAHREAALADVPRHKRHRFHAVPEISGVWQRLCAPAPG